MICRLTLCIREDPADDLRSMHVMIVESIVYTEHYHHDLPYNMYILVVQVQKYSTGIDGFFPIEQENTLEQGYIFNLCVIDNARQRSVGKSLMEAALQVFNDA